MFSRDFNAWRALAEKKNVTISKLAVAAFKGMAEKKIIVGYDRGFVQKRSGGEAAVGRLAKRRKISKSSNGKNN